VRVTGRGTQWVKRIALADDAEPVAPPDVLDYWQAQEAARKFARQQPDAPVDESRPVTVGEALDRYEADLKARGASVHNARYPRRYLTGALLAKPVALLGSSELRRWRDSLVGIKPASINRMMKGLAAALALAAQHELRIKNAAERKIGLQTLPNANVARNVILSDDTVRRIVAEAYARDPNLGRLIDLLAVTGARPSQVARLTVGDLVADSKSPRVLVPKSGKGGSRDRIERKSQRVAVPITSALAMKLKAAAKGRAGDAPLLLQTGGAPWGPAPSANYRDAFREIAAAVGLDGKTTPYGLRHSAIVRALLAGVQIRVVAANCDTSVSAIESNYSRFISDHSDEISRRSLLQDAPLGDNVVALGGR
jgi:integrase